MIGDWLSRYEDWVITSQGHPTVVITFAVFVLLALVTLAGYRQWTPSLAAWFAFAVVNAATWAFARWGSSLNAANREHAAFVLSHLLVLSGLAIVVTLFGKFVLGWEDPPKR